MKERKILDRRSIPFVIVTKMVLTDENLRASDKSIYSVLCMYANNDTLDCFPSKETILKKAGIGDKAFRTSIKRLVDEGYIDIEKRFSEDGRRMSNRYVLLDVSGRKDMD